MNSGERLESFDILKHLEKMREEGGERWLSMISMSPEVRVAPHLFHACVGWHAYHMNLYPCMYMCMYSSCTMHMCSCVDMYMCSCEDVVVLTHTCLHV